MKHLTNRRNLIIGIMLITGYAFTAQKAAMSSYSKTGNTREMKTYLIEREIPGAGKLTAEQLKVIAQTSCAVLKQMGPDIQWIQSYVTGNKIYCIYKAADESLISEHGKKGGFPVNSIMEVSSVISPATANQ